MTLRLWEMNPLHCRHILKGHTAEVCAVAMSPNGKWAVSGGHDKVLRLWDLENGQHLREFRLLCGLQRLRRSEGLRKRQ